mgnify:CR=1 FL=1
MKRPSEYPNVPYAAFVDGVGPSVDQNYLNGTEEGLADVIGSLWGRSATIVSDEFTELVYPTSARGLLNSWITTNSNSNWRVPIGANQHGILGVFAVAAGAATHLLQDASYGIGTVDFTVSMRTALDDRASLDTLAALGWFGGLRDGGALFWIVRQLAEAGGDDLRQRFRAADQDAVRGVGIDEIGVGGIGVERLG